MSSSPDSTNADQPKVSEVLRASQLKETLQQYGEALRARRKGLDKLNVYPVPDGDTGTNMSLTVQSVVTELKSAAADDMHAISTAISKGAIMGARGNSGAILAQALRGVAESVKEKTSLTPGDVADAFEKARKGAYESVLKPVEGTILTVLTAAATAARKSADEGHKLKEQLEHIQTASAEALARTPDFLPQLKQAGVVDAGGSGFLLFVDAMRFVAFGEPIPGAVDGDDDADGPEIDIDAAHAGALTDLHYEVMFLIDAKDKTINEFKERWGEVGDSIVVVGGDNFYNCHIHADDIGPVLEIAMDYGKPREVRITDLQSQLSDRREGTTSAEVINVETAVVAVLNGEGLVKLYKSLGVQSFITGGQSANPSVEELLAAVESAPSNNVIILPNNKNILPAAREVNALSEKNVTVVPTKSPVQGLSALVSYDPAADISSNTDALSKASDLVSIGEITQSVRKSSSDAGAIAEGDWLGISPDGIVVIQKELSQALVKLLDTMITEDAELVTLIEGKDADAAVTAEAEAWLAANKDHVEVQVEKGLQPLYPYLFGVE